MTVTQQASAGATVLIGAYTEQMDHVDGRAPGITVARADPRAITPPQVLAQTRNPSWLTMSADRTRVYAVAEVEELDGMATGAVHAFSWDAAAGRLEALNWLPSAGMAPAHLSIDPSGRFLAVANYTSGTVAVLALTADGRLGHEADVVTHHGHGTDPVRQEGPHPHQVVFDHSTGELLVTDLGLDALFRYSVGEDGALTPAGEPAALPAGTGPRHLLARPGGGELLVLGELDNTISVLRRDSGGGFTVSDRVWTLLPGARPGWSSGFVATADQRLCFAANRGDDSIAVLEWPAGGGLVLRQVVPCGGREPRSLTVSPDDRRLIVTNQNSDELALFAIEDGALSLLGSTPAPTPACVVFAT